MILQVFSIHDSKAAAYAPPFFMARMELALRAFNDLAADTQSQINKHPEDYTLFLIGEFDDATGALKAAGEPVQVAKAQGYMPGFNDTQG